MRTEERYPAKHLIGSFTYSSRNIVSRIAEERKTIIQAIQLIGYPTYQAVTLEATIYNTEEFMSELTHDIISQETLNEAEKRLEQIKWIADHLDTTELQEKIKSIAEKIKERSRA